MSNASFLSSVISATIALYGILFGFTFIIIQQFFKTYPYWMIKNVWKSPYLIIFIFLYPFSSIAYTLLLLGIFDLKYIAIFIVIFIIDVFYPPLYVCKMTTILHPEFMLKSIYDMINKAARKEKDDKIKEYTQDAYLGLESMFRENVVAPWQFHKFIKDLETFYNKNNELSQSFIRYLVIRFILPLKECLIANDKIIELKNDLIPFIGHTGVYTKKHNFGRIFKEVKRCLNDIKEKLKEHEEIKNAINEIIKDM